MQRLFFLSLGVFLISSVELSARTIPPTTERWGLGVTLGEPMGFSGKYWVGETLGVDAGLSYSFDHYVLLWGGALYHLTSGFPDLEENVGGRFRPYGGAGLGLGISTDEDRDSSGLFFVRFPVGLEWLLREIPMGVFMELSLGLGLVPDTEALIYGGLGARYYF
jgi:hypothetical protein